MPGTINGVGTHYYFKRNLRRESGLCEHCGRVVQLETYETWLCFCVLFIPIIPLGKRQIIGYCPSCTRHRALPLKEWQKLSAESVHTGIQELTSNPHDPKAAVQLHARLHAAGRAEEARQIEASLASLHAGNADVLMYLGGFHERMGRAKEADTCFQRALALAPEDKAARRAVGIGLIQRGEVDQAAALLSFLAQPGPDADAQVTFLLAGAWQKVGRHERALDLYKAMLAMQPGLAKDRNLRRAVRDSEKCLARAPSILPARHVPWRPVAAVACVVALIVAFVTGLNAFLASRRPLHVVNGLPVPVEVRVSGKDPLHVGPGQRQVLRVSEGMTDVRVRYADGAEEQVTCDIRGTWWGRFRRDEVFILNSGKGALIVEQPIVYAQFKGAGLDSPPPRFHLNAPFLAMRGVDYAFIDAPASIQLSRGASRVTKKRVVVVDATPAAIVHGLMTNLPAQSLMEFCESHLRFSPADRGLLHNYAAMAALGDEPARALDFLRTGLERQSANVHWHRIYQSLAENRGEGPGLVAEYDRLLAGDPTNAVLLYLRGRCGLDEESTAFFQRSRSADARFPFAPFALAYSALNRGDLTNALALCADAIACDPTEPAFDELRIHIEFGLGQGKVVEARMRDRLAAEPLDRVAAENLIQCLLARGEHTEAEAVIKSFTSAIADADPGDSRQLGLLLRAGFYYQAGKFGDLERAANLTGSALYRLPSLFAALIEQGKLDPAAALFETTKTLQSDYYALALALAYDEEGNAPAAERWRVRASEIAAAGGVNSARVAGYLTAQAPPSLEELDTRILHPIQKRLLLVALARWHPSAREALLARADQLRGTVDFPTLLADRVTARLRGSPAAEARRAD